MSDDRERLSRGLLFFSVLSELDQKDLIGSKRVLERGLAKFRDSGAELVDGASRAETHRLALLLEWFEKELGNRFREDFAKLYRQPTLRGSTLLAAICFLVGSASNYLGPSHQVNLLLNPFSLLLLWHFTIYLVLAAGILFRRAGGKPTPPSKAPGSQPLSFLSVWWVKLAAKFSFFFRGELSRAQQILLRKAQITFTLRWFRRHPELAHHALARRLHCLAVVFTVGVVAGLYLRGLVQAYEFTWSSTFIQSEQTMRRLLEFLFAPVLWLTRFQFPAGLPTLNGGQNAAWIHLFAYAALLYVIIPRAMLAAYSHFRLGIARASLAPSNRDPFVRRLMASLTNQSIQIHILSFSYQLDDAQLDRLKAGLKILWPGRLAFAGYQNLGWGDPGPVNDLDSTGPQWRVICINGVQTPEAEVHGAFLSRIWPGPASNDTEKHDLILIDHHKVLADRKASRLQAWRELAAQVAPDLRFAWVDLSADIEDREAQSQMAHALGRRDE